MAVIPPTYLATQFPGTPGAIATLGNAPGVSLNGSMPFTVQMLFNLDTLGGVLLAQPGVFSITSVFDTIVVTMENWAPVATDPSVIPVTAGTWHFVIVTFDGSSLEIFIDTVPAASTQPTRLQSYAWSNQPCICGQGTRGRIRGIQLFNFARQQSDFDVGDFVDPPQGLVQSYDFSTPTPTTQSGTPLILGGGVEVVASTVSLSTTGFGWAQPVMDGTVNPAGTALSPYSVQTWLKVQLPSDAQAISAEETDIPVQTIFANNDCSGGGGGMSLQVAYSAPTATTLDLIGVHGSGTAATTISAPSVVMPNQWTNVALTYDGATLTLYVNGAAQTPTVAAGAIPVLSTGNPSIAGVPALGQISAQSLQGNLYGLSVWSIALPATQVQANMSGIAPPESTTGFVAYYELAQDPPFNDVTGATIALVPGAVIADAPDPSLPAITDAANPRAALARRTSEPEEEELIVALRASVDKQSVAAGAIAHLERVRQSLAADNRLPRGVLRRANVEIDTLLPIARRDPFDLPTGIVVRQEHEGQVFLVHHFRDQSVILTRHANGSPDCNALLTAVVGSTILLVLTVLFTFPKQAASNALNAIRAYFGVANPNNAAAIAQATQAVVARLTSVATWGALIRLLYNSGVFAVVVSAIVGTSWLIALWVSARFLTFVASWPVQLGLYAARLAINAINVVNAWTAYTNDCPSSNP